MKQKNGFLYETHGGVRLIAYTNEEASQVEIPEFIDGKKVSHLGKNLFHGCRVSSISIPDTIAYVSPFFLYGCYSLKELVIVERGGSERFYRTLKTAIGEKSLQISGEESTFRLLLRPEEKARAVLNYLLGKQVKFPQKAVEHYFNRRSTYVLELAVDEDSVAALSRADELHKLTRKNIDILILRAQLSHSSEALAYLLAYKESHFGFSDVFAQLNNELLKDPFSPGEMKKRFSVKVQGDTALISGYSGEQTDIFIPERIGNRPITKIGAYAFSPHKKHGYKPIYEKLEKVELNCVQTLGSGAFCGCSSMKEVVANEVCAIPEHCFSGCSSLEKFDFSKITDIGDHAFENCTSLKSAILPEKLEHLGEWAFYGCSSLEELILSKSIPVLPELCFARCSSLKEASLPIGITMAGKRCFYECTGITHIDFSSTVKRIEWEAFSGCSGIQSLFIPGTVREIGNLAFYYCTGITELLLAEGIESLEWGAFSNCQSLEVVHLPKSIKKIDSHVFKECYHLKEIHIPPEITNIHAVVFDDCRYVRIFGKKDSFAQEYAWIYGIPFIEEKTMS